MVLTIEGELLDGYHLVSIPQLTTDDHVDTNALSALAGMRAVWLLYYLDMWEHLEDLGVDRDETEPILKQFHYGKRLTIWQAQQLQKKVPALVDASKELRLAYALKQLDRYGPRDRYGSQGKKRKTRMTQPDMYIYHGETNTAKEAQEITKRHAPEIEAAGGSIEAAPVAGRGGIVMVKLPSQLNVDPANILPGSGLKFSKVRAQVIPVPKPEGSKDLGGEEDNG